MHWPRVNQPFILPSNVYGNRVVGNMKRIEVYLLTVDWVLKAEGKCNSETRNIDLVSTCISLPLLVLPILYQRQNKS